jgi:hypothetical protein
MDEVTTGFHKSNADSAALQAAISETKEKLAQLRRQKKLADLAFAKQLRAQAGIPEKSHHKNHPIEAAPSEGEGYAFGARAIGKITGQTPGQVYYWFKCGYFKDAVWAPGPKSLVGSISKLRNLGPR